MMILLTVLLVVLVSLTAPIHFVLLLVFPLHALEAAWQVAGIRFDPADVVIAVLVILLLRHRNWRTTLPYGRTWIILLIMLCVGYVLSPLNYRHLTDPIRIGYQLYRYCLKWIIWFPLAIVILNDRRRRLHAAWFIILAGDIWALNATIEGYRTGSGSGENWTGGVLLCPFVLAFGLSFFPASRLQLLFSIGSAALIARGLLFAGSRGAFAGIAVAVLFLLGYLLRASATRGKLGYFLGIATLSTLLLFVVKPDLMQRPTIAHLLTTADPTGSKTLRWRTEKRWPHFVGIVKDNPWFGIGHDTDSSLGISGNTPHNGFLALAVTRGIPVLLLTLSFAYRAVRDGIRCFHIRATDLPTRGRSLVVSAAIVGFLVHNIVESTIIVSATGSVFWLLSGVNAGTRLDHASKLLSVRRSAPSP